MNSDVLLNEPIIKVFTLQYRDRYEKDWHDEYLHTKGAFEYHVTEGYWLLFETENYYVTIGYDGVQKYKKPYEFPTEKFYLWRDGDEEWTDYKETLFMNQRLHSIEAHEGYQTIYFDDFKLDLYVYGNSDEFNLYSAQFGDGVNVMAVGGHLLKKCECGGKGELLCDERSDFAVRCKECHRATYFDMILKDQIEAWNNGDTPCFIHTGLETLKELLVTQEIKYIALSSRPYGFEKIDDDFYYSCDAIIGFENSLFMISSQKINGNNFDFTGSVLTDYNRDFWSNVITPLDKISFVGEEEDCEKRKILHFKLDDADLLIEATCGGLLVALDEVQVLLNPNAIKRKTLF